MVGTIGEKERQGHIDSRIQRCLLKEVFFFFFSGWVFLER